MTTTRKQHRKPAEGADKREAYISFNKQEWAALGQVGFRERWLYMQAKWLANFRTGVVGTFAKQRLSYQALAELVTAPALQGRGMGSIDDREAQRIIERLQLAGLVTSVGRREGNGGLVFELPMSPIHRKAKPPVAPLTLPDGGGCEALILPDDEVPPFDVSPAFTRGCGDCTPSLSVMALTESKTTTDGARPAGAGSLAPERAEGAPLVDTTVAAQPPHPAAQGRVQEWRTEAQAVDAIRERMVNDWTFCPERAEAAAPLYRSWVQAGVTAELLFEAMTAAGAAHADDEPPLSPEALIPWLIEAGATVQRPSA